MCILRGVDELLDRDLVTHVDLHAGAADVGGDACRLLTVQIGDDDVARTCIARGPGQRFADARPAAGDDHDPVVQFHPGHASAVSSHVCPLEM